MATDISLTSPEFGDSVVAKIKIEKLDSYNVAIVTGLQVLSLQLDTQPTDEEELRSGSNYQMDVLANICNAEHCVALISPQLADDHGLEDGLKDAVRLPLAFDRVGSMFYGIDVTWPSFLIDQSHALRVFKKSAEFDGYNGIALLVHAKFPDKDAAAILRELAWTTILEVVALPEATSDDFHQRFLVKLLDYWHLVITTEDDGWFVEGYYTRPEELELIRKSTQEVIPHLLNHPWVQKNREILSWNPEAGALTLPGYVCGWLD